MSLLDQVRKLEQQVVDRLKELEPLTREYAQLRKLAQRLGLPYTPADAESGDEAQPTRTAPRAGTASARGRAARAPAKAKAKATRSPARRAKAAAKRGGARAAERKRPAGRADAAKTGATAAATPRPAAKRAAGRRSAARPGQRDEQVLRLVREQPGITVREIGERLGVDATGLYRVVKRLSEDRRLRKDGPRLHPVDAATSTPAAQNQATDASPGSADGATGRPGADAPAEPTP